MTLIVRILLWAGIFFIWMRSRDPIFAVVLGVVGFGIVLTGSIYLADRKRQALKRQ